MVATGNEPQRQLVFATTLKSLGRKRERWYIPVPRDISKLIEKGRTLQVEVKPLGSMT